MAGRSDLRATHRCERCRLALRWCVCAAHQTIETPLQIDVLIHQREFWRPSSTGHLIHRTMAGARQHLWLYDRAVERAEVAAPERELWTLHPHGEPFPAQPPPPEKVQIVLLDGAWREATAMAHGVGNWGRTVNLPMSGESRYWLRTQQTGGRFSTVEALIFVLKAFGFETAAAALQVQFELHVYATLRSRGLKDTAMEFLQGSPVAAALPDVLEQLNARRPR